MILDMEGEVKGSSGREGMAMKKAIILVICTLFLISCGRFQNNAGNDNPNTATDSAITGSSITASAVSGGAVSNESVTEASMGEQEGRKSKEEKQKVVIVTDETGKKRELKLGDVNVKDKGIYFLGTDQSTYYSQVLDGHYYYLRGDGEYTIYRDEGVKVGEFEIVSEDPDYDIDPYLMGIVKYGKDFFIIFKDYSSKYGDFAGMAVEPSCRTKLAKVDLQKKRVDIICDVTNAHLMSDGNIVFCNIYKNAFYFDKRDVWDEYMMRPGDSVKYDPDKDDSHMETIPMSLNAAKAKPYLTYMDGKVYYGVANGKKVTLFSHDLESGEESEIFYYERKKKYKIDLVYLAIDEDYIYCQDYLIPRAGGKMIRAFQNAKIENYTVKEMPQKIYGEMYYVYNQKYIFYIDEKDKVHRISKATKEDVIVSNLRAIGVDCTEDSVYVKVHPGAWYNKSMWERIDDDDDDDGHLYSDHLYCMDIDGKNVRRIWKGSWKG